VEPRCRCSWSVKITCQPTPLNCETASSLPCSEFRKYINVMHLHDVPS
jgi:hypothetical protein